MQIRYAIRRLYQMFSSVQVAVNSLRLLALVVIISLVGCASSKKTPVDQRLLGTDIYQMQQAEVMEYMIGPSDVLSVSVWNHADLDRQVTVRPDGRISYFLIGDLSVVGLTPPELQTVMESALSKFVNVLPGEVSVVVDAVHSYKVSVLGEVRLPGRFEFHNQVSVLDALAQAGGLTEFASSSEILIFRPYQGEVEKIRFDYQQMIRSRENDTPVLIFPGDIILVP